MADMLTQTYSHRYTDHRGSYTNLLTYTCTHMHIKILTDIHNIHNTRKSKTHKKHVSTLEFG